MFFISKLVTFLVLPPAVLILAFLASTILFLAGKKRAGAVLSLGALVLLTALSLRVVSDALIRPLEDRHAPLRSMAEAGTASDGRLVVVLGGGYVERSPEEGMKASLGEEPVKRLMYGYRIALASGLPLAFTGGRVFDGREVESEAEAARRFLVENEMTIKSEYEGESRTTLENARNIAAKFGPREVVLVTSAYHMPRSVLSFRRYGMKVLPAPTDYKAGRSRPVIADFLPTSAAFGNSWKALHEYLGLVGYRVASGLGVGP